LVTERRVVCAVARTYGARNCRVEAETKVIDVSWPTWPPGKTLCETRRSSRPSTRRIDRTGRYPCR
jgi:hypothetical protein